MDRHDEVRQPLDSEHPSAVDVEATSPLEPETHASTVGAVAAGAVTGGVIGLAGGPVGAAIGAVGGALVAAAAERMMHSDDDTERSRAETSQQPGEDELASP